MKDDYLWDKTGAPDADVEHLERVLGDLRYQRTSNELALPGGLKSVKATTTTRRKFSPYMAAAALLFGALAVGSWLGLLRPSEKRERTSAPVISVNPFIFQVQNAERQIPLWAVVEPEIKRTVTPDAALATNARRRTETLNRLAVEKRRRRDAADEKRLEAEALAAKEKLMMALQIASSKLNLAQKKVRASKGLEPES